MILPPVYQFELQTDLPVEAIKELLKQHTGELSWKSGLEYHQDKPFNSRIDGNMFTLCHRPGDRRQAGLITKGKILEGIEGRRIVQVTIRGTMLQLILWPVFLFLGIRNVMVLIRMLKANGPDFTTILFSATVLALVVFMIVLFYMSFRKYVLRVRMFLESMINSHPAVKA